MSAAPLVEIQRQVAREANVGRAHGEPPLVSQLLPTMLDRRNMEAAWERVRTSDGALTPGVDGQTATDVLRQHSRWLSSLTDDLYHQNYVPHPVRYVEIPKSGGGMRRLGIMTVRDRVVHTAMKQVLEPILDPIFVDDSFGFRCGRSVAAALWRCTYVMSQFARTNGVAEVTAIPSDITQCFDTVDHTLLMDQLESIVQDTSFLNLTKQILAAEATHRREWFASRPVGLIQGSGLSPLLCNFALHPLDSEFAKVARGHHGQLRMFRYADDLLIVAATARLARIGLAQLRQSIARLRQRLNRNKTGILTATGGVPWLGVTIEPRRHSWSSQPNFGYVVPEAKVLKMMDRINEMTIPPSTRIDPAAFDLGRWIVSINSQLRDWRQAYLFADNAPLVFRALDDHTQQRVGELLASITGRRQRSLYQEYKIRLPRGFKTWQVQGCRLTVLSSLAPHRPDRLIRRPPWAT